MTASMLLIIAGWNTEWDAATSKPEATDEANEEENPGKASSGLVNIGDALFSTVRASDFDRMIWPVVWI